MKTIITSIAVLTLLPFVAQAAEWKRVTSELCDVAIRFPGQPDRSFERSVERFDYRSDGVSFEVTIGRKDKSDQRNANEIAREVRDSIVASYRKLNSTPKVVRDTPIVWKGHRGWQFTILITHPGTFAAVPSSADVRILDLGEHQAYLHVGHRFSGDSGLPIYSATNGTVQAFFESLTLTKPVDAKNRPLDKIIDGVWLEQPGNNEVSFQRGKYQFEAGLGGKYTVSNRDGTSAVAITLKDLQGNELGTQMGLFRFDGDDLLIHFGSDSYPKRFVAEKAKRYVRPGDPAIRIASPFERPTKIN